VTRSTQLAIGRPLNTSASQAREGRVKKPSYLAKLLDSRHGLMSTDESFTSKRIAFSQGFCGQPTNVAREKFASRTIWGHHIVRIYAEDRHSPPLPAASSGGLMARHFDQQATQRAAVILKIAAHHSRDELNAALAAARRAFLYSLEEAGLDIAAGQAVFEALDAAVAISQYRA
jgi:hypothetical protein